MSQAPQQHTTNPDIESDVPIEVTQFLSSLSQSILQADVQTSHGLYEAKFPQLTQQFFTNKGGRSSNLPFRPWPSIRFVKSCFSSPATEILYQGMFYRHLYTDRYVSGATRARSWDTYGEVFNLLMNPTVAFDLPNGWLWDLLDEFIYQLQLHHNKRLKTEANFPAGAWSIAAVFNQLSEIVDASDIMQTLTKVQKKAMAPQDIFGGSGGAHIRQTLGFFAIITQMRLYVSLGNYYAALKTCTSIGLNDFASQITQKVPAAHVALYYNVGFSYMMLRRYTDASRMLKEALTVKAANRPFVDALQAQVVALLSIAANLGSLPLTDFTGYLSQRMQEEAVHDVHLLAQGDLEKFRDVFLKSCPKFISIVDPLASSTYREITGQEGRELQLRVFMREVQQQVEALRLRGYLKVYSTLEISKIRALMGANSDSDALSYIICLKHKSREKVHDEKDSDPLSGTFKSIPKIDFSIEQQCVTVTCYQEQVTSSDRFLTRLERLSARNAAQ